MPLTPGAFGSFPFGGEAFGGAEPAPERAGSAAVAVTAPSCSIVASAPSCVTAVTAPACTVTVGS